MIASSVVLLVLFGLSQAGLLGFVLFSALHPQRRPLESLKRGLDSMVRKLGVQPADRSHALRIRRLLWSTVLVPGALTLAAVLVQSPGLLTVGLAIAITAGSAIGMTLAWLFFRTRLQQADFSW